MRVAKYLKFILILMILGCSWSSRAAAPVVKAKLDSAILLMGEMTNLQITVEQDNNTRGRFPLFEKLQENGLIPVCGDSVELRAPRKIDTVRNEKGMTISLTVPVQSFDSGYYQLPAIEFIDGVDTARSGRPMLKVVPVPNLTADTPIDDYANVAEPENKSILDALPDFLYNYWWLVLLILLLIAAGVYAYLRYRKEGHILPKKPEPTPYEVAMAGLHALRQKKLWEQGMEKEYFTELTDILRTYMQKRFGINAIEMTSRQILAALSANPETADKRPMIRQILDMADFVKFAKVRPLPADSITSYENAVKFVEQTKPLPPAEEPQDSEDNKKTSKLKKVGKKKGGAK